MTRFFRDRSAFDHFSTEAIAPLVEHAEPDAELRVWVAGTATGEEAYSVAILLDEAIAASGKQLKAKIFATDVHRDSLEFAAHGVYSMESIVEIDPGRLSKYFTKLRGGSYQVNPKLRQMVVFAPHNLVKDAPFTKIDLITCRNVLIYLQPPAQKRVLSLFHFGLRTGGCMMLGPSENAGDILDEFDVLDNTWKVYRKHRNIRFAARHAAERRGRGTAASDRPAVDRRSEPADRYRGVDEHLRRGARPPHAAVDADLRGRVADAHVW